VLTIGIPPLRERIEDIPLLLEHFLNRMDRELDRNVRSVSPDALLILQQHRWPGNVRELQSAVMCALVHSKGDTLTPDCLPPHLQEQPSPVGMLAAKQSVDRAVARMTQEILAGQFGNIYHEVQAAVDRAVLREVLDHVNGSQLQAAGLLGISRTTLRSKLRDLGLVVEKQINDSPG